MKKLLYIFILPALAFFAVSCESFLEENQEGVYSEDTFYDCEEHAVAALLYAYEAQGSIEYASRFQFNLMDCTTNMYDTYGKSTSILLHNWDFTTSTEEFSYFFKYIYICINRANSVIKNVSQMSSSAISDSAKDQIVGEAYFLRAYHHFMAVRTFGEVAIHTSMVESPEQGNVAYSSIQDIYTQIISDLKSAISLLSIERNQGRGDLVAAQSTLAKVYLTLASAKMTGAAGYDWVSDYESMYAEASKYAGYVVNDQSTYYLEPDLWRVYNINTEDSPEHIWITSTSRGYDSTDWNHPMMFANSLQNKYIPKKIGSTISSALDVELYIAEGLGGWSNYKPSIEWYNSYDSEDLRRELMATKIYDVNGTLLYEWAENNIDSTNAALAAFYFPMCIKYTDAESTSSYTSAELYYLRFAEVLLTYAEAEGPTAAGFKALNDVRERAQLSAITENLGMDALEFRKLVWKELQFELAFEGKLLLELRRTNRVLEEVTKDEITSTSNLQKYADFFPIPQREADLNPQN